MKRAHPRDARPRATWATARDAAAIDTTPTSASGSLLKRTAARIARSFLDRRCIATQASDTCEKPSASTNAIIGVLIGVGVVLFIIVMSVLFFLHLRRTKQDKAELENDPHELSDYGLDEVPAAKKGGKGSGANLGPPTSTQQKRLSAQELLDASNPFGNGAVLADSDRVATGRRESPPRFPEAAVKM